MATSIREQVIAALETALDGVAAEIAGVTVFRNEDTEISVFPAVNLLDAESTQSIVDRANGATFYALDVPIEGYVAASTPAVTGPALSALYAAVWRALSAAQHAVQAIDQILEGDMDSALVTEEGAAPHAMFVLTVEIRYGTRDDDPTTAI